MKTLEKKKKNLERLLWESREGDVAAVRALLESGTRMLMGSMWCVCFLLCAKLPLGICAETNRRCGCGMGLWANGWFYHS
jgi:hypothetical protein